MRLLVYDEEIFKGGVETLCFNLLPALAKRCETLVWAVPGHVREELSGRMGNVPNLVVEVQGLPRLHPRNLVQKLTRLIFRDAEFLDNRNHEIRVLAKKHGCTHFFTTCIFRQPFPSVEMPVFGFICDVNPVIPGAVKENMVEWMEKARAIFGISDFTRDELLRTSPASVGKIHSVPLAAPPLENWMPKPVAERVFDFYYPAVPNLHKNHLQLFRACVMLAEEGCRFRLAISGPATEAFRGEVEFKNPGMEETLAYFRRHAALLDSVVEVRGELKWAEVESLYRDTRCVVLPSSYEGFGLPLAESLQRGIPVICSDIPPFREQVALYGTPANVRIVPVNDAAQLAGAMRDFLDRGADCPPGESSLPVSTWTWEDAAQRCFELLSKGSGDAPRVLHVMKGQS